MSNPFDCIVNRGSREKAAPPAPAPGSATQTVTDSSGVLDDGRIDPSEERELKVQRDRLIEKFTVMQADLGGAFYEMAIRDHVRMDVLTSKAAELQEIDAELMSVELLLEMEKADTEGICATCGTPFSRGTLFCSQCGESVNQTQVGQ